MQLRHAQLGGEIPLIDGEGLVQGSTFTFGIARQAMRMGQVAPQRPGRRIGGSGSGKGSNRSGGIALSQGSYTFSIGNLGG